MMSVYDRVCVSECDGGECMKKNWFHEVDLAFRQEFYTAGCLNKPLLFLLVLLPLVYTLLFGAAYSANVLNHIPVVVCDLQQDSISRTLIANYDTSDRFTVVKHVSSYEEMKDSLENGDAKVGLYIEPDVTKRIKKALPAEVGIYIEASNMVYGSASLVASEEINLNLLVGGSQKILEHLSLYPDRALKTAYPAAMSVRILNNPTNGYCNFMLLGLVCNGIQISLFLYAVDIFVKNKKEQWRYKSALLVGKLCAITLLSVSVFSLCLFLSQMIFAVPLRGAWYEFLFLETAFVFFFTCLGMFLSLLFPSPVLALQNVLLFVMPGLLYSGLSWPQEWLTRLPAVIRTIFPITYLALPMRDLSLAGTSRLLSDDIGILMIGGVLLFILTFFLLKYRHWQEVQS